MNEFQEEEKTSPANIQRRLQKNRMERKVRQTQMWIRRFRAFARFLTIIFLLLFGYYLLKMPQWYLPKNVFGSLDNSALEILNNKIVPSYKILAALRRTDIPLQPVYLIETDDIRRNIMQLEPVENVFIRRFWFPARLQIIIQERVPVITISPAADVPPVAFFAKGGKLIGRDYMPLDKSFKTILVLSYGLRGDDYRNWDNSKIRLIEKIAKAVEVYSVEGVEYIDFRLPDDVYVKLKTANIRLGILDDNVFERIKKLPSILPQIKTLDKKIKYVDLRWKDASYIKLE